MIYLISERSLPWGHKATLGDLEIPDTIQLDIETTGLCAWNDTILSVQIGFGGNAYVIDTHDFDFSRLKFLEDKLCIGHNIKFDLLFLLNEGITVNRVWDTYICELLLTNGKIAKRDLGSVVSRYTDGHVNKDVREKLMRFKLNHRDCIEYAGKDVLYLEDVAKAQWTRLKYNKLTVAAKNEMANIVPFTYMEQCGFYMNPEEWIAATKVAEVEVKELNKALDRQLVDLDGSYRQSQGNLFSDGLESTVNWNSPAQVGEVFDKLGYTDGDGVSVDVLGGKPEPLIQNYIHYKKMVKLEGTYGMNFLNHIKPDGRVHTNYKLLVSTGRTSSSPNLQNIPAGNDVYRHAFQAEKGNVLIVADYSGQESVILADRSKEPNLLKFYKEGGADLHSYVAKLVWPDELGELELSEIKANHSELRQRAKSTTFALAYGASPHSVGVEVYNRFMMAFPGLFEYFDDQELRTLENGYITINGKSGMKYWIEGFHYFLDLRRKMDNSWWADFRKAKGRHDYSKLLKMKDDYYKVGGAIRRKSMNYPIQGTAAHQKKRALREIYSLLVNQNLLNVVKMCVEVHDEVVIECPKEMADWLAPEIQNRMEAAANYYLDILTMKASPLITDYWTH